MRGSVRARITTAATVVVAVALIAGSSALVVFGRSALVTDVRDNLTDSLTEASKSLDRGVVTELGLLQLGLATDPFEVTARIADEECAPILAAAYGDQLFSPATFYFFDGISDEDFFAYDDCVLENDPVFDAVAGCEEQAIARLGDTPITFDEYQAMLASGDFDAAVDACLDEELLVDQRVEEAASECQPVIDAAYDGLDVLDDDDVDRATTAALDAYVACMRENGVPDYPDLTSTGGDESVLSGLARQQVVLPSVDTVRSSVDRVLIGVATAVPVLILGLALLVWAIVGRSLRPVEEIRSRVDEIGASALDQRVPQPDGDDEIARLAETMNAMLERLEDSAQRQRRFVSDASHELRSPIAAMRAEMEVAAAHPDRFDVAELARDTLEESLRMERLLDDLLTLARADAGAVVARSERVDLGAMAAAEAERVPMAVISTDAAALVDGDPLALRRVLRNLLDNAARHAASTVSVSVTSAESAAVLVIEDDGPGIPVEARTVVFDRFTRLDEGRARDAGGAGLGLAVVREIVEAHRGTVAVEDGQALGGARVVVRLPLGA